MIETAAVLLLTADLRRIRNDILRPPDACVEPVCLAEQAAVVPMLLRPYARLRYNGAIVCVVRIFCLSENSHGRDMRARSAMMVVVIGVERWGGLFFWFDFDLDLDSASVI